MTLRLLNQLKSTSWKGPFWNLFRKLSRLCGSDKCAVKFDINNWQRKVRGLQEFQCFRLAILGDSCKKNNQLYVTNQRDDSISVIDMNKRKRISTLSNVCEYPEGIDISYSENLIVVACWFQDNIILIDLDSFKIKKKIKTSGGPRAFGRFILKKKYD